MIMANHYFQPENWFSVKPFISEKVTVYLGETIGNDEVIELKNKQISSGRMTFLGKDLSDEIFLFG